MVHYNDKYVRANAASDSLAVNYLSMMSGPVEMHQWFHFVYVFDGSLPLLQRVKIYTNTSGDNAREISGGTRYDNNTDRAGDVHRNRAYSRKPRESRSTV